MRERRRNLVRYGAAFAVSLCLLAGTVFPAAADTSVSGATMRLSSREGTVNVSGKGGKAVAVFDNMRLQSGYSLETQAASYAGLALDDSKAVKMDALSRGEIRKKGKQLELLLSEGSLLCDITAPLEGDESLSIRTSTMITGIRGTVVYVDVVDSNTSRVSVLEGKVLVRPVNPVEGDRNGQYIGQGQQALVIGPDRTAGKGEIQALPLTKTDIAPYVLWEIHENADLADRLRAAGWDVDWMIENAERLLQEEEDKNSQWAENGHRTPGSKPGGKDIHTPLFGEDDSGSDSDSGSGSQPARTTVELTMPVSLETIQEQLWTSNVVLHSVQGNNKLLIDNHLIVPAGGRLETDEGMELEVAAGGTLQVDGTMVVSGLVNKGNLQVDGSMTVKQNLNNTSNILVNGTLSVDGTLENTGTITNTSMNTLDITGDYVGSGTMNNKGRMVIRGIFSPTGGKFYNTGQGCLEVEGEATFDQQSVGFGTGTTLFHSNLTVKNANGEFGDNLRVEGQLSLNDSSIRIEGGFYGGGIIAEKKQDAASCELTLKGGTVVADSGARAVVYTTNYYLNVESGILERVDSSTPFISGTGILEMGGNTYEIEELTESMFVSEPTENGWVLTGIVQQEGRQVRRIASIPIPIEAESLPSEYEEGKEPQEGEGLQEEGNPEENGSLPEEGSPGESGKLPEEESPGEGGDLPEGGSQEEGGKLLEEGSQNEGGSLPEEGSQGEGGNLPEGGGQEEGGKLPEEGSQNEGGGLPEEGSQGEGGSLPE